jgi:dTDP-4-amino-4,6-dideoxygalactose transaminase
MNAFQVVKDFEAALCEYTGAPFAVTTTSCTMALLLAVAYHTAPATLDGRPCWTFPRSEVEIPKRTYIGVPMSIVHAGGRPTFRDEDWGGCGYYRLRPLPVYDSARWFSSGMFFGEKFFERGSMVCVSFHWAKILGVQQGGAILHDDAYADRWLRKARFDGRTEGVAPKNDIFNVLGWHAYMSPEIAADGLVRLSHLPKHNDPLPMDEYPDLSTLEIFR